MNQIVKAGQTWAPPVVGTRDGNWVWDGSNWVCDPDCFPQPCPPFGPPVFSGPTGQPPWYPGANGGVSFGQTPPANPVRGHFWFDGTTLWIFDGAAFTAVGGTPASQQGGAFIGPNPPANPFPGQLWFNSGTGVMFIWDGNAWIAQSLTHTFNQTAQPTAPNPGDTWWNGTQLKVWDGSNWELVGPGATVGPVPTTALQFSIAQVQTVTGLTANQWNIAPINGTPTVDVQGAWNVTTKAYTPKKAGFYAFQILSVIPAAAYFGNVLLLNDSGGPYPALLNVQPLIISADSVSGNWVQGFSIQNMNGTTDFVRVWCYGGGGSYDQSNGYPVFKAWLLP